jgi:hypothetical protein
MTMPESRQLASPEVTENAYLGFLFLWKVPRYGKLTRPKPLY